MAINLLGLVKDQLSDAVIGNAAKMIGGSTATTGKALQGIMPTLLGSMMKKSSTTSGAGDLLKMITDGGHDGGILDNIGDLFQGGEASKKVAASGDGILSGLLGGNLGSIVGQIASFAGLPRSGASSLLSMAAPILMGLVGKQVKSQGLNASGLASMLGDQKDFIKDALPAGFGETLGLGSLLGGVKNTVSNAANAAAGAGGAAASTVAAAGGRVADATADTAKKGVGFIKWLLPLVLLFVLGGWLLSKAGCDNAVTDAANNTIDKTTNVVGDVAEGAKDAGNAVVDGVKDGANAVVDGAKDAGNAVVDGAKSVGSAVAGFGSKVVNGVKSFTLPGGGTVDFKEGTFGDKFTSFLGVQSDKLGERFTFDNLTFNTGSANLTAESLKEVEQLSTVLRAFPKVQIKLEGHTDNVGNPTKNQALSLARANAVKNQLAKVGINAKRITTEGLGSNKPTATNDTAEGRAANRRIEVIVTQR